MLALKLAYKNLLGAGLRTWLNVIVLSFAFVMIILFKGMLDGWDRQARNETIEWEIAGGQFWHKNYDPTDPFTLSDSHTSLSTEQQELIREGLLSPQLISRATIYPEGRMNNILIRGIQPGQELLSLPTRLLDTLINGIPAIIGSELANRYQLTTGSRVTLRWRDAKGVFDADEILIFDVFDSNVPAVSAGVVWIGLEKMQEMMQLPEHATLLVAASPQMAAREFEDWEFRDQDYLLQDIDRIIKSKSAGSSIFYVILLLLAMLAIFDTQVLSVFRRQKEIGTYIAMGMTKRQVISLFTVEGGMHAILAILAGAIYGIPVLIYQSQKGISFGMSGQDMGITMAETLYPIYSFQLVITTVLIVTITTTIVSFLPAQKISGMNPTDAIKGKLQ